MAVLAAVLFCALGEYWVHSLLLVLFMGLFVIAAWVLTHSLEWYIERGPRAPAPAPTPATQPVAQPTMASLRALWRSYVHNG